MSEEPRTLDRNRLLGHYRLMNRIRAFEQAAIKANTATLVPGFIHPSIGQEAVPVGVCAHLGTEDLLLSTHRGHGHTLAKGADAGAMMLELYGREGGYCRGKGGSMHIADFSIGMLGANGVVAANITIAAGAAHGMKLQGKPHIVACFFGDGATNRGPFLEGLNWARVFDLPVLFVCEDNSWSATTKTHEMMGGDGPLVRARALGLPGAAVNGNDIMAVDEAARIAVETIRRTGKPYFLHCLTYRHTGHTGTDPAGYRLQEELDEQLRYDPVKACAGTLRDAGVTKAELAAIEAAARTEMEAIAATAEAAPWPQTSVLYEDVQDNGAEVRP
jgi:pyruvate dehydrogenase E1 component alpha subunit